MSADKKRTPEEIYADIYTLELPEVPGKGATREEHAVRSDAAAAHWERMAALWDELESAIFEHLAGDAPVWASRAVRYATWYTQDRADKATETAAWWRERAAHEAAR